MATTMGRERSKPLHNFKLPCSLKWGNQRFLRCAKVDPTHLRRRRREGDGDGDGDGGVMINHRGSNGMKKTEVGYGGVGVDVGVGGSGGGDGIAAVREKLMFDLQTEADKIKYAIFRDGLNGEDKEEEEKVVLPTPATAPASNMIASPSTVAAADSCRPWNLRTRRAACKAPMNGIAGNGGGGSEGKVKVDGIRENGSAALRLRSEFSGAGAGDFGTGEKRKSFSVTLNRKEIQDDFMEMVGHRPPRRPKKRAKFIQKNMDTLFPGLWLTEITPDLYKVAGDQ
ncbi:hypothetical protein T459_26820 [Capsicum annuum]|uniref:Uncharacterized protein n=1 Tax=Capsicum annuum TaxID=4072 RepID=A0A2G2YC54_CAPAN|nr:uncharacterized protein LOC107848427 [Capsicum annuum]PHT67333.1 hypothetical protein T459_26820 [Capsicum annuum]